MVLSISGNYAWIVQRLFSTFPTGSPGAALLILRLTVAASLLLIGAAGGLSWTAIAVVLPVIGLCLGFLTPYCAVLCCLMELRAALLSGKEHGLVLVVPILNSIVLAMIGPGAYSLDSQIFGRQLVRLPPRRKSGSD
jgi:hypothetical protein